jgi:hypothetical protein
VYGLILGPNVPVGYTLILDLLKRPFCVHQRAIPPTELISGKSKLILTVFRMMERVRSAHDRKYAEPHVSIMQSKADKSERGRF